MKKLLVPALLAVATAMMVGMPMQAQAQGQGGGGGGGRRGNFDPEQMRARMMERYREVLEVKDDAAWKVVEGRIQAVTDARRDVGVNRGMGMMMGGRRGGGGGGGDTTQGDQQNTRRNFGGQQSQAAQDLQKAIDSKASNDQLKAKLQAYREDHKTKQQKLEEAQTKLKEVLNVRQEAAAVLAGLLD